MTSPSLFCHANHEIPGKPWRRRCYFTPTTFCFDNEKWQRFLHCEVFLWLLVAWQCAAHGLGAGISPLSCGRPASSRDRISHCSAGVFHRTLFCVIYHVITWNILLPGYCTGVEHCRLKVVWNSLWRGGN